MKIMMLYGVSNFAKLIYRPCSFKKEVFRNEIFNLFQMKKFCLFIFFMTFAILGNSTQPPKVDEFLFLGLEIGANNELFVRTNDGIFRSIDEGEKWEKMPIDKISTLVVKEGNLFSVQIPDQIEISQDGGLNWSVVGKLVDVPWVTELQRRNPYMTDVNDGNFYVCVNFQFLYVSSNIGKNWEKMTDVNGCNGVAANKKFIYVLGNDALYKSRDQGKHWETISGKGKDGSKVLQFGAPDILRLDKNGNLFLQGYVSNDEGASWEKASFGLPSNWKVLVKKIKLDTIYLSIKKDVQGSEDSRYFSMDGKTAKYLNFSENWLDMIMDRNKIIYIVTYKNIYKSSDQGLSWNKLKVDEICHSRCSGL